MKTVNLKQHKFAVTPTQLVWMQVAGFQAEHLAMLRFSLLNSDDFLSIERATCVGQVWNYNLYSLRPKAHESFNSQLFGTKNIKNSCEDFSSDVFWHHLAPEEYQVGIFETSNEHSLETQLRSCQQETPQLTDRVTFWKMASPSSREVPLFHYQDQSAFELHQTYYDQTCQGNRCFSGPLNNVRSIWERFSPDYQRKILIIRDYTYLNALRAGNIARAREILAELMKIYEYFEQKKKGKNNFTLLLSSAEGMGIEMPLQGSQWADFEQRGRNIIFRRSALKSSVFANGARAENFCGLYKESELPHRLLWSPGRPTIFSL